MTWAKITTTTIATVPTWLPDTTQYSFITHNTPFLHPQPRPHAPATLRQYSPLFWTPEVFQKAYLVTNTGVSTHAVPYTVTRTSTPPATQLVGAWEGEGIRELRHRHFLKSSGSD
ncbi:hypothetical protein E2C01_041091 [Portunus trituberculatus]|uniref:Uncharacterized protein n=1 Tax=Portunus trituberculatus TaxID=210409 RepID=A0A5B7FQ08_PORTR|nr:hypothetical protein [Portunus trituberculatus]